MTKDEILKGIAPYKHDREVLRRILRRHGELSEMQFDRIFSDVKYVVRGDGTTVMVPRMRKVKIRPVHPDAFILGDLYGGRWSRWLNLLQFMVLAGQVRATMREGSVSYSLV